MRAKQKERKTPAAANSGQQDAHLAEANCFDLG